MEEDRIIIKPVVIIDRAQAWFYTSEWQEGEKKVDRQIKEGKIHSAESLEDLYKKLNIQFDEIKIQTLTNHHYNKTAFKILSIFK